MTKIESPIDNIMYWPLWAA